VSAPDGRPRCAGARQVPRRRHTTSRTTRRDRASRCPGWGARRGAKRHRSATGGGGHDAELTRREPATNAQVRLEELRDGLSTLVVDAPPPGRLRARTLEHFPAPCSDRSDRYLNSHPLTFLVHIYGSRGNNSK
jgi:hypothetical protein